jgi:hypothetical protein
MGKLYGFFIIKIGDNKILCSCSKPEDKEVMTKTEQSLPTLLASPGWKEMTSDKLVLEADGNVMYNIHIVEDLMYVVLTSKNYTQNVFAQCFCDELETYVKSASRANINASNHRKWFSDLVDRYHDDKISTVQNQIKDVTDTMTQNIRAAIDRGEKVADLEDKTEKLRIGSEQFQNKATKIKQTMRCRNWKIIAIIGTVVLIVITIIVIVAVA